jgi:hypothetical protein
MERVKEETLDTFDTERVESQRIVIQGDLG